MGLQLASMDQFTWRTLCYKDSEGGVRCISKGVCLLELATMASAEPGVMDSTSFLFSTVPMACLFYLPNRFTSG